MSRKCRSGKVGLSELEAKIVVARRGVEQARHRKNREVKLPCRYYPCSFCGRFHTTSQAKNQEVDAELPPAIG